jgi:hypothetical protein
MSSIYNPQLGDSVICLLPEGKDGVERKVILVEDCTDTLCIKSCDRKKIGIRFPSNAIIYALCSFYYELKTFPDDVPTKILRDAL